MEKDIRESLRRMWRPGHPGANQFADRVRQARLAAGIEQVALAKAVGQSRPWVAKRELGFIRMKEYESEMLLAAIAKMKASQKLSPENKAKEPNSSKPDNGAIS